MKPNPELIVEVENLAGSGPYRRTQAAETTIGFSQRLELSGKPGKRARVGQLETEQTHQAREAERLTLLAEVDTAFTDVLAAQERLALAERHLATAKQVVSAVGQRVGAGKDPPVAAQRATVELGRARIAHDRARRDLETARQRLAATWGASEATFERARGRLDLGPPPPDLDTLSDLAARHPDVTRRDTEIEQRRAALSLARAGAIPDPTLAASYRRFEENGDSALVLGLALPLPVANRNQGAIAAAQASLAEARSLRRAVLSTRQAELAVAWADLRAAHDAVCTLATDVVPGAEAAFAAAETGYRAGKLDYLAVLDAQRSLFEARAEHLDSLADYHRARTRVEQLIGQALGGPSHD